MHVLIFAAYYHPHIGGYEKNIHELAKRLVKNGYWVGIITCNTEDAEYLDELDGVDIKRLKCWHILNKTFPIPVLNLCNLRRIFNKEDSDVDIVVTQTRFFPTSLLGLIYSKIKGIPLIHVERGTCHSVVSNKLVSAVARFCDHTVGSMIVRSAKVNVGVSEAACAFIKHLGGKVTMTIYNGIEAQ